MPSIQVQFRAPNAPPVLPPVPKGATREKDMGELMETIRKHNEYPPLMQSSDAWLRLAPYKEQLHCRTPSDAIANNFSPKAADLRASSFTSSLRRSTSSSTVRSKRSLAF